MDPRLEEASRAGDLVALHALLQEDSLLLDRLNSIPRPADNPLHVAALLGHVEFGVEILRHSPGLARGINAHGFSPLHIASAGGQLHMVREILKAGGVDVCRVRDGDGLTPVHTAASSGWVRVVELLIASDPESALELTYTGDTALHLALKFNCFEAAEFLARNMNELQEILINSKDENGDTALHLATAKRQVQTIKLLLSKHGMDVNMVNLKGQTALDALLQSQFKHGDLALGGLIRAAGGNSNTSEARPSSAPPLTPCTTMVQRLAKWKRCLLRRIRRWLDLIFDTRTKRLDRSRDKHEDGNTSGTVMVVSTLIATITFQAALNPPGGFDPKTGYSVLGQQLNSFLIPDVIGLFASLSVILLFICVVPRGGKKNLTRLLLWVMWIAVYSTAIAFSAAIAKIFPDSNMVYYLSEGWIIILIVTIGWIYLRFVVYLLQKVGLWWEEEENPRRRQALGPLIIIKRIILLVMVLACNFLVCLYVPVGSPWIRFPVFLIILVIPSLWIYLWFALCSLRVVGWWKKKKQQQGYEETNGGPSTSSSTTTPPNLFIKRILTVIMITTTPFVAPLVITRFFYFICPLKILLDVPICMFGIPGLFLCFSSTTYLLRMVGWWKRRGANTTPTTEKHLVMKRIMVIVMIVVALFGVGFVNFYLPFHFIHGLWKC